VKSLARARDRAEIAQRLARLRADSGRRWGRMTAHQMVCHLADALRMGMGRKPVTHATSLFHRTLLKWVVLYAPLRWPTGIVTSPEIDQQIGGTRPAEFTADVAEVVALMDLVTAADRGFAWARHPVFGRMSHGAWLRWGYLHMDHHLRQFGA
jgi:hypothetical protein